MCACLISRFSHVWLFATPWTVACQAPLSRGSSWPRDRIHVSCLAGKFFTIEPHGKPKSKILLPKYYYSRPFFLSFFNLLGYSCFTGNWWLSSKESACQCRRCRRHGFDPWIEISCRRAWQLAPIFFPEKVHGQRSLKSCSPWGCKESDTTEFLSTHTQSVYM